MVMSKHGPKCSPNDSSQGNGTEEAVDSTEEPGSSRGTKSKFLGIYGEGRNSRACPLAPPALFTPLVFKRREVQPRGSPGRDPGQPYRGPRGPFSGDKDAFRGNENKSLTAISNRNTQQPARQRFGGRDAEKQVSEAFRGPSKRTEPARKLFGGQAPQYCGGRDVFSGIENKRLTAFSNRNTNESRKLATLSKSTISNFLIATKWHCSEEKAKRE
jgi:hypothetical protein